jgi:hypothetical protein
MFDIIDDFKEFAPRFLKVKNKAGAIVPFQMNLAQEYIYKKLEGQLTESGMVRAIILKGRQQGCCFAPHMRVLTADYRWIPIGSVKVGDALVACDESPFGETKAGRKHSRKFRTAIVEHTETFEKQLYEVVFDNGAVLEVTNDHRMLCKKRGGTDAQWREVGELIIGDSVRVATRPPTYEQTTYEDGWISGVIDGEGSSRTGNGAKRLSIHQRNTPILGRIKSYFDSIQMPYKEVIDARIGGINKLGRDPVHRIDIHRLPYLIEIFSRCRPTRFTNDRWHEGHELPGKAAIDGIKPWAKVVSIRPLSVSKVIDLQTSTKTYICEGLVSHNSTFIEARFFHKTITNFGKKTFILTHEQTATSNLFEMTDRYYQNLPDRLKPELSASNAKELKFGKLDSSFVVATAGNKGAGRSATAHLFHGSEAAYWPSAEDHQAGIMQTIPMEAGTEIVLESTANGIGNMFHRVWKQGEAKEGGWLSIFVPWYWQQEYRHEGVNLTDEDYEYGKIFGLDSQQMQWRRHKIGELGDVRLFMREYPASSAEAFSVSDDKSLINSRAVQLARKAVAELDESAPKIIGVDPARFGKDSTSMFIRQGRVAERIVKLRGKDTMQVVGEVIKAMQNYGPDAVFIDVGGIGAGVYDRLKEIGNKQVFSVNFGGDALDKKKYVNKRAEIWCLLRDWVDAQPAQIPDDDILETDLCGLRYSYDSNGRVKLESKEDAEKRGIKSPDDGDALALTFTMPIRKNHQQTLIKVNEYQQSVPGMGM